MQLSWVAAAWFLSLIYRARSTGLVLGFIHFCINGDPNLALFCPSLVKLHRTSSGWQGLGSPLLSLLFACVQVMFLLNLPCAAQRWNLLALLVYLGTEQQ